MASNMIQPRQNRRPIQPQQPGQPLSPGAVNQPASQPATQPAAQSAPEVQAPQTQPQKPRISLGQRAMGSGQSSAPTNQPTYSQYGYVPPARQAAPQPAPQSQASGQAPQPQTNAYQDSWAPASASDIESAQTNDNLYSMSSGSYANPYANGPAPTYGSAPPAFESSYNPDWSGTTEPQHQFQQNRVFTVAQGQNISNQIGQQQQQEEANANYYGGIMNNVYGQIAQNPGYTSDEASQISREPQLTAGMTTPGQFASLNETPEEQAAITGNPSSYGQYYDPGALTATALQGTNMSDTAMQGGMDIMGRSLGNETGTLNTITGNPNLLTSAGYGQAMQNGVQQGQSSLNYVNPQTLQASQSFLNSGMTPQQENDIVESAANNVRGQYEAQLQNLNTGLAAAGNSDPLAAAAARNRLTTESAADQADAMTTARIQAQEAGFGEGSQIENTRLGAAQNYAGLGTNTTLAASGQALSAAQQEEATRLGAQQFQTGQQANAAETEGQQGINIGQFGASEGANIAQQNEQDLQQAQQFAQSTGISLSEAMDQIQSQRAQQQYQNRVSTGEYGQTQGFQQNLSTQQQLANAYQQIANARITGTNNVANWATGETNLNQELIPTSEQQQLQAYAAMLSGLNSSAAGYAATKNPSLLQQLVAGGANALPALLALGGGG